MTQLERIVDIIRYAYNNIREPWDSISFQIDEDDAYVILTAIDPCCPEYNSDIE